MAVKLAQASINEWGGTHGGNAGNQTRTPGNLDGELNVREWYDRPWTYCIRPKDPAKAEIIANTALACVKNVKIGYDQNERQSLYRQMKANDWDATKVGPCETDCSSLWGVCANSAGIYIDPVVYTGTMKALAEQSGAFEILTDPKYTRSDKYLKRGDGLVKPYDHAVIVISNGSEPSPEPEPPAPVPPSPDEDYKDVYVTTASLWLRIGPGTNYQTIIAMPSGTQVYVKKIENGWADVLYNNTQKGYASAKYLKLVKESEDIKPIDFIVTGASWLREDAGVTHKGLTIVPANTRLHCDGTYKTVLGRKWYKAAYNGKNGYISSKYLEEAPSSISLRATGNVNMRKGPGTDYAVLQVVPIGATVSSSGIYTTAQGVRWYECTYKNVTGYLSDKYLKEI